MFECKVEDAISDTVFTRSNLVLLRRAVVVSIAAEKDTTK